MTLRYLSVQGRTYTLPRGDREYTEGKDAINSFLLYLTDKSYSPKITSSC